MGQKFVKKLLKNCRPTSSCRQSATHTTTTTCFPECQLHSGEGSNALGEELSAKPLTVNKSSPRAENHALGKPFPSC
jgi:hypothetical protein